MNRLPLERKIVVGLTGLFLCLAMWFFYEGWKRNREFREWQTAETVRLALDLRTSGHYAAPLRQTCSSAHGMEVEFNTGDTNALTGLRGELLVRDKDNREVVREEFDGARMYQRSVGLEVLPRGLYGMEVTITQGATGLTTTNHALVGKYLLCGLERAPSAIANIIGGICLFLALLGGVVTHRYLQRIRQNE